MRRKIIKWLLLIVILIDTIGIIAMRIQLNKLTDKINKLEINTTSTDADKEYSEDVADLIQYSDKSSYDWYGVDEFINFEKSSISGIKVYCENHGVENIIDIKNPKLELITGVNDYYELSVIGQDSSRYSFIKDSKYIEYFTVKKQWNENEYHFDAMIAVLVY